MPNHHDKNTWIYTYYSYQRINIFHLTKGISYKFWEKFGNNIHFSASWGESFSNSAIWRELSTIFSDHMAINSNPVSSESIKQQEQLILQVGQA